MTDAEKYQAIQTVIEILKEDFDNGQCGRHEHIVMSCAGCQAVMVAAWLTETNDWCYSGD